MFLFKWLKKEKNIKKENEHDDIVFLIIRFYINALQSNKYLIANSR